MNQPAPAKFLHRPPIEDHLPGCKPIPLIRTENLSLFYGLKPAFEGVSWSINKGCLTALVGPSGCGKTSFLTCLNRLTDLIPRCSVSGRLYIEDRNILSPNTDLLQLRRRVGMIFQKPNPFPMSLRKNLELPLKEHGVKGRNEIAHRVETALNEVGLWDEVKDRLGAPALTLSGGQQQRLCIARAIILSPAILLMDEPCSALDPLSGGLVEDLITKLRGRYTVVIVTHNLAQARRIADYTGVFWVQSGSGQLIEQGTSHQIFENPQHQLTRSYINGVRG